MHHAVMLILLLGALLTPGAPVARADAQAPAPLLSVVTPRDGDTLAGTTVQVMVETAHFTLVSLPLSRAEAGQHPELNQPNIGHIQLQLDDGPPVVLDRGSVFLLTNVPSGAHTLTVALMNVDHSPLSPPAQQVIVFRTLAPQGAGAAPVAAPKRIPHTAEPADLLGSEQGWLLLLLLAIGLLAVALAARSYVQVTAFSDIVAGQLRSLRAAADPWAELRRRKGR